MSFIAKSIKKIIFTFVILVNAPVFLPMAHAEKLLVLVPGAGSSGETISIPEKVPFADAFNGKRYFKAYEQLAKKLGYETLVCPATQHQDQWSKSDRVDSCFRDLYEKQVCQNYSEVRMIGHSLGGNIVYDLLKRSSEAASGLGCIKKGLAISAPFLGSEMADLVIEEEKKDSVYGRLLRFFDYTSPGHMYILDVSKKILGTQMYEATVGLSAITNYESEKRVTLLSPFKKILASRIQQSDVRNDGVVPLSSMSPKGIGRLAIIDANHFETGCFSIFEKSAGCKRTLKAVSGWLK